ncbi:MAG: type II toxin-antitoxin system RelE/ParE family toxin [Cyclobacteriaceae bacterium]|nr:type II toxin-antitoxin system RelE/ParE family toxin [Cyclobacteriaceae bacterium]
MVGGKRQIIWTLKALEDKTAIMEYWVYRNQSVTFPIKLSNLFNESLELLSRHPEIGKIFTKDPLILYKSVRNYRLYYTFDYQKLILLTIWDSRRNPENFKL